MSKPRTNLHFGIALAMMLLAIIAVMLLDLAWDPLHAQGTPASGAYTRVAIVGPDPCQQIVPTAVVINFATASLTTVISGVAAKHTYICAINIVTAAAQNINLVAGTGTNCGTAVHVGYFGGATAATGWNFAANGGLAAGGSGQHIAGGNDTAADNICYTSSGASQVSGSLTYVQQ